MVKITRRHSNMHEEDPFLEFVQSFFREWKIIDKSIFFHHGNFLIIKVQIVEETCLRNILLSKDPNSLWDILIDLYNVYLYTVHLFTLYN